MKNPLRISPKGRIARALSTFEGMVKELRSAVNELALENDVLGQEVRDIQARISENAKDAMQAEKAADAISIMLLGSN